MKGKKLNITREHDHHIKLWKEAYDLMNEDVKRQTKVDPFVECLTYDKEKTIRLPLP